MRLVRPFRFYFGLCEERWDIRKYNIFANHQLIPHAYCFPPDASWVRRRRHWRAQIGIWAQKLWRNMAQGSGLHSNSIRNVPMDRSHHEVHPVKLLMQVHVELYACIEFSCNKPRNQHTSNRIPTTSQYVFHSILNKSRYASTDLSSGIYVADRLQTLHPPPRPLADGGGQG